MNWGRGIIVAFVLFIGVIATMVYISVNTEFSLVADNYYEQEIAYEDQLDRIRNYNALEVKPEFKLDRASNNIVLTFDEALASTVKEGELKFFRASGAKYDQVFPIKFNEQSQVVFNIAEMLQGAWTLQVKWSDGSQEFYNEIKFVK